MDSKKLGDDGHRRLNALVDRFGRGDLAVRLGLSFEGLGAILSGSYEMGEERVTNILLLIQALEWVPSDAPPGSVDESIFESEEDYGAEFGGEVTPKGVVDAGPARMVEYEVDDDEGLGGVGLLRQGVSGPDPALALEMGQTLGVLDASGDVEMDGDASPVAGVEPGGPAPAGAAEVVADGVAGAAPSAPSGGGMVSQVVALDLDQDGSPDVLAHGIDLSSRPGMAWMEQQERRRMSLRNAHALAIMTQYRIGMTHLETVTSLGLVTQIELALITYFRESLPEPGQNWDSQKRAREIERRLARLRWVEQEQEREDSGLKGMWNRVRGRGRPSGKELYERMVKNADTMIMGMQEPDRDDDVLADVLRFTGVGPEDPGYRELVRRPATN